MIFSSILTITIFINKLSKLNEEVALIYIQWPGSKTKK